MPNGFAQKSGFGATLWSSVSFDYKVIIGIVEAGSLQQTA
jgi:hypothetical protein